MDFVKAILLAVVEGITEFLPISSTGHLILLENVIGLGERRFSDEFMVLIQFPAILAVVFYFWSELWPIRGKRLHQPVLMLWIKVGVAFLPAAVLGFLYKLFNLEEFFFSPLTVAIALSLGGVVLILIESFPRKVLYPGVQEIPFSRAILVGLIQCLAMIPGVSRSAATIMGAMLLGTSRPAAAEFSFFLAIPTMLGAFALTIKDSGLAYTPRQWALIGIGSLVSFLTAYAVIAFLMQYVKRHNFIPFGIYRIILGVLVLILLVM